MTIEQPVLTRMQTLIDGWEILPDRRAIFLTCYSMMTRNMLLAVDAGQFRDSEWVLKLLHRFADYYFVALDAYEQQRTDIPAVWQYAFEAACQPHPHVLQHLVLGVNAHICYDLIFALVDVLQEEWASLTPEQREQRYDDHCHVNTVIYHTIDSVQTQVVERYSPLMDVVDKLFGFMDEWLLHQVISLWREQVWESALLLMASSTEPERQQVRQQIDERSMLRARCIMGERGILGLLDIV